MPPPAAAPSHRRPPGPQTAPAAAGTRPGWHTLRPERCPSRPPGSQTAATGPYSRGIAPVVLLRRAADVRADPSPEGAPAAPALVLRYDRTARTGIQTGGAGPAADRLPPGSRKVHETASILRTIRTSQ